MGVHTGMHPHDQGQDAKMTHGRMLAEHSHMIRFKAIENRYTAGGDVWRHEARPSMQSCVELLG